MEDETYGKNEPPEPEDLDLDDDAMLGDEDDNIDDDNEVSQTSHINGMCTFMKCLKMNNYNSLYLSALTCILIKYNRLTMWTCQLQYNISHIL